MFRLHIDIPLSSMDEEKAIETATWLVDYLREGALEGADIFVEEEIFKLDMNYRLGHDEDRQKSNYLSKTNEGHVTKKKCRTVLDFEDTLLL